MQWHYNLNQMKLFKDCSEKEQPSEEVFQVFQTRGQEGEEEVQVSWARG